MSAVLRDQAADEQQVAARFQPPTLQRFGAAVARRVGAIADQLGLAPICLPVVGAHRLRVRDDDAPAGGSELFAGAQVPAGKATPLVPPPVSSVHVEDGPPAAHL